VSNHGLAALAAVAALALAACGGSSQGSSSSGGGARSTPAFDASAPPLALSRDPATKTVGFTLVAGFDGSNGGQNFNGHSSGGLVITVPLGWTVDLTCRNKGPLNHSCVVVNGPSDSGPALPGASTPNPVSGFAAGQSAALTFPANKAGVYRIACLVPGHETAGMWETFRITASGNPGASVVPS
jgi:hypothetical protein